MEINKTVTISGVEQKTMRELSDSFSMIIDAMDVNDYIETNNHIWEYDDLADIINILSDFAENEMLFIAKRG